MRPGAMEIERQLPASPRLVKSPDHAIHLSGQVAIKPSSVSHGLWDGVLNLSDISFEDSGMLASRHDLSRTSATSALRRSQWRQTTPSRTGASARSHLARAGEQAMNTRPQLNASPSSIRTSHPATKPGRISKSKQSIATRAVAVATKDSGIHSNLSSADALEAKAATAELEIEEHEHIEFIRDAEAVAKHFQCWTPYPMSLNPEARAKYCRVNIIPKLDEDQLLLACKLRSINAAGKRRLQLVPEIALALRVELKSLGHRAASSLRQSELSILRL